MSLKGEFESLEVRGLDWQVENFRLQADFRVEAGERVAIHAPSGSGKTSLLRLIAGLMPLPSGGGIISLGGADFRTTPPERRNIGMVFQEGLLFPQMTALENVAYPLKLRGFDRKSRDAQAREWLGRLELGQRLAHFPHELSGGERQRVAFARALVFGPKLVLLDEAFSALDLRLRGKLADLFKALHAENPAPTLFVTHDAQECARLGTRTLRYETNADATENYFSEASGQGNN